MLVKGIDRLDEENKRIGLRTYSCCKSSTVIGWHVLEMKQLL